MGERGPLEEFPVRFKMRMTTAQQYRLDALAVRAGGSQAGMVRALIDHAWKEYIDNANTPQDSTQQR